MAKGIAEATTKIYEQLERLPAEERRRAVDAALTMLGESPTSTKLSGGAEGGAEEPSPESDGFSGAARALIKKHSIDTAALAEMFHLENGKVQLILAGPLGKSKKEQTLNTYLLTGLAAFLETGSGEFQDDLARGNCQHLGCYDKANHSVYMKKEFGNKIVGSKAAGWKLTAPGLSAAAKLVAPAKKDDE
jgi:hypothetical protein